MTKLAQGRQHGQLERSLLSHERLVRHVLRLIGVAAVDEDDALQDSLLTAVRLLRAGQEPPNVKRWLAKIAHNQGRNYRQRRALDIARCEQQATPGEHLAAGDANPERRAAAREHLAVVASMPARDRELLSAAAVGEQCENHPGLQHARERLRKRVA